MALPLDQNASQTSAAPESLAYPDHLTSYLARQRDRGQLDHVIDHWKYLTTLIPPIAGVDIFLDQVSSVLAEYADRLGDRERYEDALAFYQHALYASGTHALKIYHNAAVCLAMLGRLDDSIAAYQKALQASPTSIKAQSGMLLSLNYTPGVTPAILAHAYDIWNRDFVSGRYSVPQSYPNNPNPKRPLNVGLISSDFWRHPGAVFLVRFLENCDSAEIRFHCYMTNTVHDEMTDRVRMATSVWHDTHDWSDEQLTQKVSDDSIDILIDMIGHTGMSRLPVFARKQAPVQISWLGYPGENGLKTMDYVIGDRFVLPLEMQPHMHAKILHLPDSFVCYDPLPLSPPVPPLPAKDPGAVTFGCFNNPLKCNPETIKLWARILKRLPRSHLVMKYRGFDVPSVQQRITAQFAAHGVAAPQLEFRGMSITSKMFQEIGGVDIALDPFPFAGGLMTCITLYMGVPVVTMKGETFAGRQGFSFLSTLGITETVADDAEDYVEKAVALANDLGRLAVLRRKLRPAIENSPLCDGRKAGAALQSLLRQVWRDWCEKQ
jgi:protein O-GlcNAc transferase